jgi:hypothetical protein
VPIKVKVTYSSFYQCIEDFNMKASSDVPILSPLLTQHINPYGRFELDLETRLLIEEIVSYDN